ncbi:PhzF family phenazine biosynthesis protein [Rickettsiella endosymbiont of Dermanyssus gallinae]|uniref:PhzF family phenazine biosynthesis protein n=1 Tax=Rickettsiella endosymbiont of Dermanyssus gallinae TaxID=2856608 RepID=UPI001C53068D|nr:PhzF family phenazine biosynthesis protein [Rickettsiella endosymbiont of Dermanyssus gallinae]
MLYLSALFKGVLSIPINPKIINVFSVGNRGGNPCAIVDCVITLSEEAMQKTATELNLPETVYIIPDKDRYLLRFFATKEELPLCCHGTLGAVFYLFKSNVNQRPNIYTYKNNIKIDVKFDNDLVSMSLENKGKVLSTPIDFSAISAMLNIDTDSVAKNLPCTVASIGSPKLFVPIINRAALFGMKPELDLISQWCKTNAINGVYAYSDDTENPNADYVGRNFNPLFSHQEDIATGTAAATLGQLLCINRKQSEGSFTIEQGANLESPSQIFISISKKNIEIKGQAYFSKL